MRRTGAWLLPIVAGALVMVPMGEASASPSFSRKYKTSCVTCHAVFPKLNDFGRSFKLNGYQFPEDDAFFVKEERVVLGNEAYKDVWPDSVWPSWIPESAPVALQMQQRVERYAETSGNGTPRTDFRFPTGVGLISGVNIDEDISAWLRVQVNPTTSDAEVERGFVAFNDILQGLIGLVDKGAAEGFPEGVLSLRVGKLDAGVMAFNNHVDRLTLTPFNVNSFAVGNNSLDFDGLSAAELYGYAGPVAYTIGVSNGTNGRDNNSNKDAYGRLAFRFGGLGWDGAGGEPAAEGAEASDAGGELSFTLGLFGYVGKSYLTDTATSTNYTDAFWRAGVDARLSVGSFSLFGAYMKAHDEDAFNNAANAGTRNSQSFATYIEANYEVYPWLVATTRYEHSDLEGVDNTVNSVIPSVTALIRPNLKLIGEGRLFIDDQSNTTRDQVLFALDIAF